MRGKQRSSRRKSLKLAPFPGYGLGCYLDSNFRAYLLKTIYSERPVVFQNGPSSFPEKKMSPTLSTNNFGTTRYSISPFWGSLRWIFVFATLQWHLKSPDHYLVIGQQSYWHWFTSDKRLEWFWYTPVRWDTITDQILQNVSRFLQLVWLSWEGDTSVKKRTFATRYRI